MKYLLLSPLLLLLFLAACARQQDRVILVRVTADPGVGAVARLRVTFTSGDLSDEKLYPADGPRAITFPTSFSAIAAKSRTSGELSVDVEALAADGGTLARGSGQAGADGTADVALSSTPAPPPVLDGGTMDSAESTDLLTDTIIGDHPQVDIAVESTETPSLDVASDTVDETCGVYWNCLGDCVHGHTLPECKIQCDGKLTDQGRADWNRLLDCVQMNCCGAASAACGGTTSETGVITTTG